jgi:heptosyltransferase-1
MTPSNFRLLVVRLGAMGDILHALPAVTALRLAHPDWQIDWVVEPRWQALLAAESATPPSPPSSTQPLIDHLHFAATKAWRKAPFSRQTRTEFLALRSALRAAEYDAVIDLQGSLRSALIASLAGCRRLIGEENPRERPARWLFTERVLTRGAHVIEQDLELAATIAGDKLQHVQPWLPVDPAAAAWVDGVLPKQEPGVKVHRLPGLKSETGGTQHFDDGQLNDVQPAVLINPGAGWGAKRWPAERYAAVAQGLVELGCCVFINVGPGEEPLAEVIVRQTHGAATALNCSLAQLIALTRRVRLAIAGDTGPLHLACALGVPVVGIYGPTDPSRNGPFGTRFTVLRSPQSRRDHTRYQAPEAGLLTIQPEEVLRVAGALLYP